MDQITWLGWIAIVSVVVLAIALASKKASGALYYKTPDGTYPFRMIFRSTLAINSSIAVAAIPSAAAGLIAAQLVMGYSVKLEAIAAIVIAWSICFLIANLVMHSSKTVLTGEMIMGKKKDTHSFGIGYGVTLSWLIQFSAIMAVAGFVGQFLFKIILIL